MNKKKYEKIVGKKKTIDKNKKRKFARLFNRDQNDQVRRRKIRKNKNEERKRKKR